MSDNALSKELFAFNTVNTITAYTDDDKILEEAAALCIRYEFLFSRTRPDSELSRINEAGGRPVAVDDELAAFIQTALDYCARSDGLFDITMGSVTRLWDFKERLIPTQEQVDEALTHVDYRSVRVEGNTVTLNDPLSCIDLGGIAKGYIADKLIALLASRGVSSGLVNLGGNVAVLGGKPDGSAWNIGLRVPVSSSDVMMIDSFAMVSVRDMSVVTSGIYERSFMQNNTLYHHILDPKTGFPAETDLLGASIISRQSLDADGFTTALIIMGLDRALDFVEADPCLEAVFVTTEGTVFASSGVGHEIPFRMLAGAGE
jgi:FAD:protein FMN transferase